MTRVLIADKLSESALDVFEARGIAADFNPGLAPDALIACIGNYDGLAVRSATKVTAEVVAAAGALRVVGRAGIGVDNIDVPSATARGIVVMNTPSGNSITTAEHAVALIFALARDLPAADRSTRAGKWEKSRFMGVELTGKTLGVIGCGNIGSIVCDRALGLKMRVLAYDPYLSGDRASALRVEKVELDALLQRADFITLHVPLNDATRNILDAAALGRTKPGVRIVNCARGGLIDEAALAAALESGHVAGAALDVFAEEPARDNPLFGIENIVVTPHLGAATAEAQENVAVQVAEQMADYLLDGAIQNAVNMPSISPEEAPRLRPYIALAEQLGSFAGQITETGIDALTIEYSGEAAELNTRSLTAAALTGLLRPLLDQVNMVNAPVLARERGIEVTEIKRDRVGDYSNLIGLTLRTERRTRSVEGSLLGGDRPRIVGIEGIKTEAQLGPFMLYIRNQDVPGIIGYLGKTLGDAGVNIATFHLGRMEAGGEAIALIKVDEDPGPEVLATLRGLPAIRQAKVLRF
ncbi:MAG: phosphoglycerate dehydrogenase [Rhodospirillaceae bacterium]|jgi:D-3-phosphoglycerate dehydrogenase / 2-oxoglutarate reductase|nr:phosphoglycerate dehydrogenase [Rhodospirillaceae bacterium]MBT6119044.1 phosphoglycerate dehydrogenase [Rhodospirillaceae bacterium]